MHQGKVIPVILAGGAGTRLAPLTSEVWPKPFLPLPDGRSLLSHTCVRVADSFFSAPVIVGQACHRFGLMNRVREAGLLPSAILLEPLMRNTAMAVAVAVAYSAQHHADAILAIMPADHAIGDSEEWRKTIAHAVESSQKSQAISLVAVHPTQPNAAYGHMQLSTHENPIRALRFVEKPEDPQALMAASTEFPWFWNAGQFIAPVSVFKASLMAHAPKLWHAAIQAVHAATKTWEFTELAEEFYRDCPAIAFDRAVIEKESCVAALLKTPWHDLGTVAAWERYTGKPINEVALPDRVDRPWGYFEALSKTTTQVEKRLILYPHCRLSLQRHQQRNEHWEVLEGNAEIECGNQILSLSKGHQITIPANTWHRLHNKTSNILIIKEIQTGNPDENDIERILDDYGRS